MAEDMPRPPADYEIPMSNPTREISAGNLALVQMAEDVPRPPNKIVRIPMGWERAYNFVSTRMAEDVPRPPRDKLPKYQSKLSATII